MPTSISISVPTGPNFYTSPFIRENFRCEWGNSSCCFLFYAICVLSWPSLRPRHISWHSLSHCRTLIGPSGGCHVRVLKIYFKQYSIFNFQVTCPSANLKPGHSLGLGSLYCSILTSLSPVKFLNQTGNPDFSPFMIPFKPNSLEVWGKRKISWKNGGCPRWVSAIYPRYEHILASKLHLIPT